MRKLLRVQVPLSVIIFYAFLKTTFLLLTVIFSILKYIEELTKLSDNFLLGIFINSFVGKKAIKPPIATLKPPFIEFVINPFRRPRY